MTIYTTSGENETKLECGKFDKKAGTKASKCQYCKITEKVWKLFYFKRD